MLSAGGALARAAAGDQAAHHEATGVFGGGIMSCPNLQGRGFPGTLGSLAGTTTTGVGRDGVCHAVMHRA